VVCNGWTLPTQIKEPPNVKVLIEWKTFVIVASDSEEAKGNLMKDAIAAIENDSNVAILGIQIQKDHFGQETKNKVVFLHRAGGEKRLSFSKGKLHASSRMWGDINSHYDLTWVAFKQMVGKETKVVTYSSKNSNNLFLITSTNIVNSARILSRACLSLNAKEE
jgi:hypothetical protein